MASNNNVGSTALIIAAWFVAAFLALKFLPSILGSGARAAFGSNGQGGPLSPEFGGYAPGLPFSMPVSIGQALQTNNLSPDSAQALATLYNAGSNVVQPDGSPLTAGQLAALMPQYDNSTNGDFIPFLPFLSLPNSDFPTFSAGDYSQQVSDATSGDFNPDNYAIDSTIPYNGE